jgi:oxygen-independent coproporphyrinogen-3 oxidase
VALDRDDRIRREVIARLMCHLDLDTREIEEAFGIDFEGYFAREIEALRAPGGPVESGLLALADGRLTVVGHGRLFVRNICMAFDRYLRSEQRESGAFSRTV